MDMPQENDDLMTHEEITEEGLINTSVVSVNNVQKLLELVSKKVGIDTARSIIKQYGKASRMVDISSLHLREVMGECQLALKAHMAKMGQDNPKPKVASFTEVLRERCEPTSVVIKKQSVGITITRAELKRLLIEVLDLPNESEVDVLHSSLVVENDDDVLIDITFNEEVLIPPEVMDRLHSMPST